MKNTLFISHKGQITLLFSKIAILMMVISIALAFFSLLSINKEYYAIGEKSAKFKNLIRLIEFSDAAPGNLSLIYKNAPQGWIEMKNNTISVDGIKMDIYINGNFSVQSDGCVIIKNNPMRVEKCT